MTNSGEHIALELDKFIAAEEVKNGLPSAANNPGHRQPFIWPRHSLAAQYNVKPTNYSRTVRLELHGEAFEVLVADTSFGVFGRCESLNAEAKGSTEQQMIRNLKTELEPLFERQFAISRILNLTRRFEGAIQSLPAEDLVKLLYCSDRDVASCAMNVIDATARSGKYAEAMRRIMLDESHPNRRSAQWCALDILEDMPNVCTSDAQFRSVLNSVQSFMVNSPDDFARAVYKAGDVLGDHVATEDAQRVLLYVLRNAKYAVGRRSAIHGLIHLCEWLPNAWDEVHAQLLRVSENDPEPLIRVYAADTIKDIKSGEPHGPEPVLPGEAA